MKKNFSKTAFTLIELIVSLALVSVVVLGIFSINTVLNNNNQDYGQRYLVKSETQTTLNHILNNASLAFGSATNVGNPPELDQGILIGPQMGAANNNSFCIHQSPTSGDIWICYTLDTNSSDAAYQQITYCNKTYNINDSTGYRGASGSCTNPAQFLGTANSITILPAGSTLPQSPYFANSGGQLLFSITITNCLNDSLASCNGSGPGISSDPANNPEVQVSGSVSPPQESI